MLGYMTYRMARSAARGINRSSKKRKPAKALPISGRAFLVTWMVMVVAIVLIVNYCNAKW